MRSRFNPGRNLVAGAMLALVAQAQGQTLGADFAADYTVTDLGSIAQLPSFYGGLTFLSANAIIIGGNANFAQGLIYQVAVQRDAGTQRITGFGAATPFRGGSIGTFNDGGVVFGPGGVLFTSQWPENKLGQTKPGSTVEDKVIDLAPLGVADSHAALNFVPAGFGGAGKVKLVTWETGEWYSASLAPDGAGTFDLVGLVQVDVDPGSAAMDPMPGGPEGFVYVDGANPGFGSHSLLVSEFSAGSVAAYQISANGDPVLGTRRDFLTGLEGAEGATLDPVTGDFLFSTFGGGDRVVLVSGFTETPPPPVPEPQTAALFLGGLATLWAWARRRPARHG
jgi:MYXO-CTERM domain-containing protein